KWLSTAGDVATACAEGQFDVMYREKSPLNCASVGTYADPFARFCLTVVPWYPAKKNTRSFIKGPPMVPPNWFRFSPSPPTAKKSRAFRRPLRKNSNRSPWNLLEPDFVTASTVAPECPPLEASCALVKSRNSCSASGNGKGMLVPT